MKRYLNFAVTAVVACSLALTAVNVSAATHASSRHADASLTPPKLKKGVTLNIWDYFCTTSQTTCPERDVEMKVIKQWEKLTGDKVNLPTNPDNHTGKMCTAAPSGQAPDIVAAPQDSFGADVACQVVSQIPAWAWTPAQKKGYIRAAIQATTVAGKTYAMPWAIETTGLFYNKALISASAFKPAKGQKYLTWAKLIPEMKKAAPSSGYGFGWDQANFYYDYAFISGYGGYVFKFSKSKGYDYKSIGLATSGAVKGLTFIRDLTTHGKYGLYSDSMNGNVAEPAFDSGKMAVFYWGPWGRPNMDKGGIKYGFQPLPSFDGKHPMHPFSGVQLYYLNKYGKNQNEAASLVAYLTTHLAQADLSVGGRVPVTVKLINSKQVQSDPILGGLAHAALAAQPMPNIPEMGQVWTPMGNAISLIVKDQATPAAAAQAAVQEIRKAIANAHGG